MKRFMAKLIAAENKARSGLRHAVCPNVTGKAMLRNCVEIASKVILCESELSVL